MDDRYPFLRFITDAAQVIAGAVALVLFFGGSMRACHHGGFGGLIGFLVAIVVAGLAYIVVMVKIEVLRVLLDLESNSRELLAEQRTRGTAAARDPGQT